MRKTCKQEDGSTLFRTDVGACGSIVFSSAYSTAALATLCAPAASAIAARSAMIRSSRGSGGGGLAWGGRPEPA